mmetsp:Transcript_30259/g.48500  ORF Transcript_30259/g.48500 Transcript_30259/m.48500 type:complete len:129 (-) Transcript_30259:248-634(-)
MYHDAVQKLIVTLCLQYTRMRKRQALQNVSAMSDNYACLSSADTGSDTGSRVSCAQLDPRMYATDIPPMGPVRHHFHHPWSSRSAKSPRKPYIMASPNGVERKPNRRITALTLSSPSMSSKESIIMKM